MLGFDSVNPGPHSSETKIRFDQQPQPKLDHFSSHFAGAGTLLKTLANRRCSRKKLKMLQEKRLRHIVRHAYSRVPFYRELFDKAQIAPDDIQSISDLEQLPVTTKKDLRNLNQSTITAQDANLNRCIGMKTSGSTGIPLEVPWDESSLLHFFAVSVRAHLALRCSLTDKILSIGPRYYPENLLIQKFGISPVQLESPFQEPAKLIQILNQGRPEVLLSYPSVLKGLVHYCEQSRENVFRPRIIITSGEYLEEQTAERAEKVFGSRPFQFYGSWEMGRIGNECEFRSGLHINEDLLIAELLPVNSARETNSFRLVLTNLFNRVMPFIRYDQGDIVTLRDEPCPCGSNFLRIELQEGRESDVIRLPSGNQVSVLRLTSLIFRLEGISQFRFIQENVRNLTIEIVEKADFSHSSAEGMTKEMANLLQGVHVRLKLVERIEPDSSGKTRQFESRLES